MYYLTIGKKIPACHILTKPYIYLRLRLFSVIIK